MYVYVVFSALSNGACCGFEILSFTFPEFEGFVDYLECLMNSMRRCKGAEIESAVPPGPPDHGEARKPLPYAESEQGVSLVVPELNIIPGVVLLDEGVL